MIYERGDRTFDRGSACAQFAYSDVRIKQVRRVEVCRHGEVCTQNF